MLRNLFKRKQTLNKDQIAELLKVHPEALELKRVEEKWIPQLQG